MNNDTMYLLNRKKEQKLILELISKYQLELCYNKGKEKIFKNGEIMLACHPKYNIIQVFTKESNIHTYVRKYLYGY